MRLSDMLDESEPKEYEDSSMWQDAEWNQVGYDMYNAGYADPYGYDMSAYAGYADPYGESMLMPAEYEEDMMAMHYGRLPKPGAPVLELAAALDGLPETREGEESDAANSTFDATVAALQSSSPHRWEQLLRQQLQKEQLPPLPHAKQAPSKNSNGDASDKKSQGQREGPWQLINENGRTDRSWPGGVRPWLPGPRGHHQLRQLLDFYFEPFNLQHNRFILDVLARKVKQKGEPTGPWSVDQVATFVFNIDDMMGLGRIKNVMSKIRNRDLHSVLRHEDLRHLNLAGGNGFRLRSPCEARRFVHSPRAPVMVVEEAVKYLCAVREVRAGPPERMISVLSYSLSDFTMKDGFDRASAQKQQRCGKLRRQVMLHLTDFMCIQGIEASGGTMEMVTSLNYEETNCQVRYETTFAEGEDGWTGAIIWDCHRWQKVAQIDVGESLAVDFMSLGLEKLRIRVVSMRPKFDRMLRDDYIHLFPTGADPHDLPVIVCSDLYQIGGAHCAVLQEQLAEMNSAMKDVLGDEVLGYAAYMDSQTGELAPERTGASELLELHAPDAVLYENLEPLAALSGHTEAYLATLDEDEVVKQFPAFRLPLISAFQVVAEPIPDKGDEESWPSLAAASQAPSPGSKKVHMPQMDKKAGAVHTLQLQ